LHPKRYKPIYDLTPPRFATKFLNITAANILAASKLSASEISLVKERRNLFYIYKIKVI
jgi:hypothetical protein